MGYDHRGRFAPGLSDQGFILAPLHQPPSAGGLYFIEDWGTGYWDNWEDGSSYQERVSEDPKRCLSHDHGMVGFIKQLVDETGRNAIHRTSDLPSERRTMFNHMCINPGFVMVQKKRLGWD